MTKNEQEFLEKYIQLCKKHNLIVTACGCCSSPWIEKPLDDPDSQFYFDNHIKHLKEGL